MIATQGSAIDTPLPKPRGLVGLMVAAKPEWVVPPPDPPAEIFQEYPNMSIAEWHTAHNAWVE